MLYRHYATGWKVRGLNLGNFKTFFLFS